MPRRWCTSAGSLLVGFLSALLAALALGACGDGGGNKDATGLEAVEIATRAYVYGYAPVAVARKAWDQTHSTEDEAVYAPINELYIDTSTATPESQLWVSPNVNVLYASAHLDLSAQPMVLFTPELQDRYFSWEIMDAYTNAFAYIGSRATGGAEGSFALVGPGFEGDLPAGYTRIDCPTNAIWLVARIEVTPEDSEDLDVAIGIAQQSVLLPLDEFLTRPADYVNPIIEKPPVDTAALDTDGLAFFTVLNDWLTQNPPPAADDAELAQLARIGVGPGFTTDFEALPPEQRLALEAGIRAGSLILTEQTFVTGTVFNGWRYNLGADFGDYGTNYLLRALTARGGLGANVNAEAVYPLRLVDQDGLQLKGDRSYTITFAADQLPVPIDEHGFWSITMYDRETGRLVANSIDRYSLGSQNPLATGEDGSITLYLQAESPGSDIESNWLPTPANGDPFYLLFRAYYPDTEFYTPSDDPAYKLPELLRSGPLPSGGDAPLPPPLSGVRARFGSS